MKTKICVLIFFMSVALASCSLFENLNSKSEQEKTIELLTKGGLWKLDSAIWTITSEAPGSLLTLSDSVFLNYGTWEFQAPLDAFTRYGTGYLIHRYNKKGNAKVDTLAWTPFDFSTLREEPLTIFFPDPTLLVREIVIDDLEHSFNYLQKDKNLVRIKGQFGFSAGVATTVIHTRKYRISR